MMEVHYQVSQNKLSAKLQREISKKIYQKHRLRKGIGLLDFAIFIPLILVCDVLFLQLADYAQWDLPHSETIGYLRYFLVVWAVAVFAYGTHFRPKWMWKMFADSQQRILNQQITMQIAEMGLAVKGEKSQTLFFYHSISAIYHRHEHLVILINDAGYLLVPDNAFASDAERLAFEQALIDKTNNENLRS